MAEVRISGRDGTRSSGTATTGIALMDFLRDANTGVEGICGGACSCGTCHVYVSPQWADKLPPKGEDEAAMLEAIGEFAELRPTSRLSCQIPMTDELDGIEVEIGPAI